MKHTVTLRNGVQVPALGLGTWFLGENKAARAREMESLRTGISAGMTLIDTAEMYGNGKAESLIKEVISDKKRDDLFLVSKVLPNNAGKHRLEQALDNSMKRMGVEYLDLYLYHWRGNYPLEETVAELDRVKKAGKIKLISFQNFCPYSIDLDYYKDVRAEFNIHEWIDVILGAVDYNADGYEDEHQKLMMITRLLPFVEKRLNLIELAPKGTGKSYIFGQINKNGNLTTGVMTRAKLFYDLSKRTPGIVYNNDFVAFDEVQKLVFPNGDEIGTTLKGYMESGKISFAGHEGTADAGIILLGNISQDSMDEYKNMFSELPAMFRESALIDRFHGFIKGWEIPRMHDDLKISGWALNSEYFCTILHLMRSDASYRAVVDEIVDVPEHSDTRDTEAVKRIATAYLKLLFPNVRASEDVVPNEFRKYCLRPAVKMRSIIKKQLALLDDEFKGKDVPNFDIKESFLNG